MIRNYWSRNELIVAFNLYCKIPFSKITSTNKLVIDLAAIIGRTPSAVALKLSNFARLDPMLKERNIAGMRHGSKADVEIWNEFTGNWDELSFESEQILAIYKNESIEKSTGIKIDDLPREGKEREAIIRTRVNQSFFRQTILSSYDNRCCITRLSIPELLIASHIIPWAVDKKNRMNPSNGLCLNCLHDKAFDKGLITITTDYRLKLSKKLAKTDPATAILFNQFENQRILLPNRFLPSLQFIEFHNKNIYIN